MDGVLHHSCLFFVPKAIWTELINCHYDNPLTGHFNIKKMRILLAQKYYQPTLCHNIEAYVKGCNLCLVSKVVQYKPYCNLQSLLVCTYWWKDLLTDFVIRLSISTNLKRESYDFILVIVNWLTKMVFYKLVKVSIDATDLVKILINVLMWHYGLFSSIVTDRGFLFSSNFWSLLYYFFVIKRRLFTVFYLPIDKQTKWQNCTIEVYLWAFVNFEQNNLARLLSIAGFAYNNTKNANIGHTAFELDYNYHRYVFFKKDINPRSKSKTADK